MGRMSYEAWNTLLAKRFFNPDMAGRRVYLYTTDDLIEEIGRPYKAGMHDFIAGVKAGAHGITRGGVCLKALHVTKEWKNRASNYPPYVAYLALFVLAAGLSGDFAPHAYYPRLRKLLGEEPALGMYPHFDHMIDLWDDLERWSNEDRDGALGVFTASISGGWIHVGLPIAQAVLSEDERRSLPTVFARAGFDPIVPPSDPSLVGALLAYGRSNLRPRTLKLLDGPEGGGDRTREALLDVVLEELQDWDGTVRADAVPAEGGGHVWGALRLCCALDPISGRAHFTLRCSTAHNLPDGGLVLTLDGHSGRFSCDESVTGWSSPVEWEDGVVFDAITLDWARGARMRETDRDWVLTLPGQPIHILTDGAPYGLAGLVEARQLAVGTSFYLVVRDDCGPLLESWGTSSCARFRAVPVTAGLPAGWRLYQADGVRDDSLVRHIYPMLALPSVLRVDLFGGLRVSRRSNQYFRFAPPRIVVHGGADEFVVCCNGVSMQSGAGGLYDVPDDVLSAPRLLIQVHRGGEEVGRRSFYFLDSFAWRGLPPMRTFDAFGNPVSDGDASHAFGATVTNVQAPPAIFGILDGLRREREVALIGREPGQIATWPREPLPTWEPVWAVTTGKRLRATFRGSTVSAAEPGSARGADRTHIAAWKDLLWYHRRRIVPPAHKGLRALWELYVKEAGRVR